MQISKRKYYKPKETLLGRIRILDAIKLIRDIPAVSPDTACKAIISLIQSLPPQSSEELKKLTLSYTSYVRTLLGAMLEYIGRPTAIVRKSLNGVTSYKLPISESVSLPCRVWQFGLQSPLSEDKIRQNASSSPLGRHLSRCAPADLPSRIQTATWWHNWL